MAMTNPYNYTVPQGVKLRMNTNQRPSTVSSDNTPRNGFDQYKEQAILTARPEELTLMLYNGIIKFLNQAKIFMEQKNIEKSHNAIIKAQNIIFELNVTLNMDYEISSNLRRLYDFMNDRLIDANIEKNSKIVDEVLEIATEMRDTWKQAMKLYK